MSWFVPSHVENERRLMCNRCEHKSAISVCMKCGCFIPTKIKLANTSCPLSKWVEHKEQKND